MLSHNDREAKLGFNKVKTSITPDKAHELLSCMMNLVNEIEFKTGRATHRVSSCSHIVLPRDNDGVSFIQKLSKSI